MMASRHIFGTLQRRAFSASARQASKVAVLGGAGGIGQPLSLLMKLNPRVSELAVYDIKGAAGVAADIGHINTKSVVTGYQNDEKELDACLKGSEIVLIPAGVPRKPGMTRDGKVDRYGCHHPANNDRPVQHQCFHCPGSCQSHCRIRSRCQYPCHLQPCMTVLTRVRSCWLTALGQFNRSHRRRDSQVKGHLQS